MRFDGQVALVTGAGRGLGRAYAKAFGERGAKVVVNDLGGGVDGSGNDSSPADEVVAEIADSGGEAVANYDSVVSYDGGYNMVKQAIDSWGRLDIAVCNAGILRDLAIHNMGEADWDAVLDVHLKGCFTVARAAWPVFRQQAYGRLVLASSGSGLYGNFGQVNYSSAKMGMVGMMNTLKLEGAKYNVNVHCISPGAATRMTEALMPKERLTAMAPEHVAPVVAYLCSRECTDSGLVIEAGGGNYSRSAVVKGNGIQFVPEQFKTAEWVGEHWEKIINVDGATTMWGFGETRKNKTGRD
ncbi:MAG TPA: SDR family oxidoreductase [Dehalococcoidia bacterium]|nr:SDR family oxidoreductase [Dehalococcoidia bacterium]